MSVITVDQWVDLFKAIGLSEKDMKQWHSLFEQRYPDGHQDFLEWLGLDDSRIKEIRSH